jgi:hypothetical protein
VALNKSAARFLDRRPIELAKSFAEGDEVVVGEMLTAEEKDRVIEPGAIDGGEIVLVNGSQVYLLNLGSERGSRWDDSDARPASDSN